MTKENEAHRDWHSVGYTYEGNQASHQGVFVPVHHWACRSAHRSNGILIVTAHNAQSIVYDNDPCDALQVVADGRYWHVVKAKRKHITFFEPSLRYDRAKP